MARRQHRRRNFSKTQWVVLGVGGIVGLGLLGTGVYLFVIKEEAPAPTPTPVPAPTPTEASTEVEHPALGAVEIVTFTTETGAFTWRAEWADGSTFSSDVFATEDLAYQNALDMIAQAYGPWESDFGVDPDFGPDPEAPTGTGTFEYRGVTITVEKALGVNYDWSATLPWGATGTGTNATTGTAHIAARAWIDENLLGAIQMRT